MVGLKDSSGDWNNTAALLERFPGFAVFPGSEVFLLDGLRKGARRLHHRLGQRQRAGHPQGLRELADAAGRRIAGRDHDLAQDDPGLSDGPGAEAHRRAFPQRPGLGRGAPADGAADRGAIGRADRRSRQDRLYPRRAAAARPPNREERRWRWSRLPPAPPSGRPSTTGSRPTIWRRCGSGCTAWSRPSRRTPCLPAIWHYREVRPHLMQSGGLITAQEATRRVLILMNPGLGGEASITGSLFAGLQLILPGEVAPAHRHTQSALRFIIEGQRRLYRGRRRAHHDAARRFRHHPVLDLARPRQRHAGADGLARRARHPDRAACSTRALPSRATGRRADRHPARGRQLRAVRPTTCCRSTGSPRSRPRRCSTIPMPAPARRSTR